MTSPQFAFDAYFTVVIAENSDSCHSWYEYILCGLALYDVVIIEEQDLAWQTTTYMYLNPDSKVHAANMGPIWGRQEPGGPHIGPIDIAIC